MLLPLIAASLALCQETQAKPVFGTASPETTSGPTTSPVQIGANLEGITDWSFSNFFADLVKQSRGFGPPSTPWSGTVSVDANGWPTEDFGVILATWTGMKNIGGTYKISFNCSTTPTISLVASPGVIQNELRNPTTGIVTADLVYPEGGGQLMLGFTGTVHGVQNLHVMRPGYVVGAEFTTPILNQLKQFNTFRFMDWAATNASPQIAWANRTLSTNPTYANGNQVPWEACIDICNQLNHDAWINVPHMANDAYVASLAHLFHTKLNPGLHVYIEYSNEVWNWGFEQAQWNLQQAQADVAAGDPDLNYDKVNDSYTWAARRIAKRIKTISDQFKTEYGASAFQSTVRPVLATQVEWPAYWLVDGLNFLNARYGAPSNYLYACAGAPYFNLGDANDQTDLTEPQVIAALSSSVNEMAQDLNIEACETLSRYNNLQFVAYEGGPDTFGPNDVAAKSASAADPKMRTLVDRYMQTWLGYGGGLFNWYCGGATNYDTAYGTWGLTDDIADTNSQKLLAIQDTTALKTVTLNQGIPVPGSIDPRHYCMRDTDWKTEGVLNLSPTDWRGNYRDYLLRVETGGTKSVTLLVSTPYSDVLLNLYINNAKIGSIKIPYTGGYSASIVTAGVPVALGAGMNVLRVQIGAGSGCNVSSIGVR
jgi:hypothetical protein